MNKFYDCQYYFLQEFPQFFKLTGDVRPEYW